MLRLSWRSLRLLGSGTIPKTIFTMTYDFGDIVLVPFPFTDQSSIKRRPGVIVSSDAYNQRHIDVILMAVTSQTQAMAYA
ncbi:MAG: type II toxin-antitoxin system PemK/MazF family toxin, partial [Cyanobacteria bacterium J06632_22]